MKKGMIVGTLLGTVTATVAVGVIANKQIMKKDEKIDKFRNYYDFLNQWLILLHEGKKIDIYFKNNGYKTVAIYGMGEMGNRLYEELKNSEIEVRYAIDKNAASAYSELEVKEMTDELEQVDIVVVTATFAFEEILEGIENKFDCPIVSLEDVIYDI